MAKEYKISDLAVLNIRANISLMAKLMEHFKRGQRTIDNMLDAKDKRFTEPEVVELIIENSGLYRKQILEEDSTPVGQQK